VNRLEKEPSQIRTDTQKRKDSENEQKYLKLIRGMDQADTKLLVSFPAGTEGTPYYRELEEMLVEVNIPKKLKRSPKKPTRQTIRSPKQT
jgi:hypothetical protein